MKNIFLKILTLVLTLTMLFCVFPISAFAEMQYSGDYTYRIKSDGTVAIEGYYSWDDENIADYIIPQQIDGRDVTELCAFAFNGYECDNIVIPATVSLIQPNAFDGMGTEKYTVDENNSHYKSVDGVIFSADEKKLVLYPRSSTEKIYTVPDGVTEIVSWAFNKCILETVILPTSLKVIGSYAFCYCSNLYEIVMPEGITDINEGAFLDCGSLNTLYIPSTVSHIGDYALYAGDTQYFAAEDTYAYEYLHKSGIDAKAVQILDSIDVTLDYTECFENTNGYTSSYNDPNGEYYEYYIYNDPYIESITLTYSDGTQTTYSNEQFYEEFGYYPDLYSDQNHLNTWHAGETHAFYFSFLNNVCKIDFTVLEPCEISDFSVTVDENRSKIYENTNGSYSTYYDEDGTEYNFWYYNLYTSDFLYSFTYDGHQYIDLTEYEVYEMFGIYPEFTEETQQSYFNQYTVGLNRVDISLFGSIATSHIEILPQPKIYDFTVKYTGEDIIEKTHGSYVTDSDGSFYWAYNIDAYNDFTFSFTDEQGERHENVYSYQIEELYGFTPELIEPIQDNEHILGIGEHTITFKLLNSTASTSVNIIESPYTKIEIVAKDYELVENFDGYTYTDSDGNECFNYQYDYSVYLYTNDTEYEYFESYYDLQNLLETECLNIDGQSYETPWTVGEYTVNVDIMGLKDQVNYKVVENPVKSVKILSDIKTQYYTNDEIFNMDDLTLEIEFKNGNIITHTVDINPDYYYSHIKPYYIEGYPLECAVIDYDFKQWVEINYYGYLLETPVYIKSPEITSAEFITPPQDKEFSGAVIRVTENDGSTKDFTVEKSYTISESSDITGDLISYSIQHFLVTDKGIFWANSSYEISQTTGEISNIDLWFLNQQLTVDSETLKNISRENTASGYIEHVIYDNYFASNYIDMYFDGRVTAENIDYLIHQYVNDYYLANGQTIKDCLNEKLNIIGEIDLTLSNFYNEENDSYDGSLSYYVANNCKNNLKVEILDNGNYKYYYDYWVSECGEFKLAAEVTADGKLVSVSNAELRGDINTDGEVNILDLIHLKNNSLDPDFYDFYSDMNSDSSVNSLDFIAEKKYLFEN